MEQPLNLEFGIDISSALAALESLVRQGTAALQKLQTAVRSGLRIPKLEGGGESGARAGAEAGGAFAREFSRTASSATVRLDGGGAAPPLSVQEQQMASLRDARRRSLADEIADARSAAVQLQSIDSGVLAGKATALEKESLLQKDFSNSGVVLARRSAQERSALEAQSAGEGERAARTHQSALTAIAREGIAARNAAADSGAAGLRSISAQGLDWLDERWKLSCNNQKTALFAAFSSMMAAAKNAIENIIQSQAKQIASNILVGESEEAKQKSFAGSAAAAVASAARAAAAWASSAAQAVASGATFIAENLAAAASSVASAVASAIAWLVSTLGPFGFVASLGAVTAIVAEWTRLKSALGFAKGGIAGFGGFGLVGERGPEVVAPVRDFSAMVADLVSMTQRTMLASMHWVPAAVPDSGAARAIGELTAGLAGVKRSIERLHTNINVNTSFDGQMRARGNELYSAISRDTLQEQITRA